MGGIFEFASRSYLAPTDPECWQPANQIMPAVARALPPGRKTQAARGGKGDYARLFVAGRGARFTLEGSKSALFGWSQTTSP